MFEQPKLDKTIKLMQPILDTVNLAKHKSVILVVGGSGDGKSTLLNYLHGCTYEEHIKSLGKSTAKLKLDSLREVCEVGKNLAHSKTLYPQVLEMPIGNEGFVYCDLPGFFETHGEPERICAAAGPHILSGYIESIKGIIWVINLDHFTTNKCESIKKMLDYLLKISQNNSELIANSLTIVITHSAPETQKKGILKALTKTIKSIEDPHKKALLQDILKVVEKNPEKIVISNVFDAGESKIAINKAVSSLMLQPTGSFDFSCYTDYQSKFNEYLVGVADNYLENTNELVFCSAKLNQISSKIAEKTAEGKALEVSESECEPRITAFGKKVIDLELFSKNCEIAIDDIEKSEEYIKIEEIQSGKKDPQLILEENRIGRYPSGGVDRACGDSSLCREYERNFKSEMLRAGCTRFGGYDEGGGKKKFFVVEAYKSELVPIKGIFNVLPLSYSADFPVKVEYKNINGVSIKPGTEKISNGFEVTLIYDAGMGIDVSVEILTLKKYSSAGQSIIVKNMSEKEKNNAEIKLLQHKIHQLQKIQLEFGELREEEKYFREKKEKIEAELSDRKYFFKSVYEIAEILKLSQSNENIQDFATCFRELALFEKSKKSIISDKIKNKSDNPLNIPGLTYQKVFKDGHCLFNAVGLYVGENQQSLRNRAAIYFEDHWNELSDYIILPINMTKKDYLKALKHEEWACNVVIEVLMRSLERPIVVIDSNGQVINHQDINHYFEKEPIFVHYNGCTHYNAFILSDKFTGHEILNYLLKRKTNVDDLVKNNFAEEKNACGTDLFLSRGNHSPRLFQPEKVIPNNLSSGPSQHKVEQTSNENSPFDLSPSK